MMELMEYKTGHFGVLNLDHMEGEPLRLLDGGIERRCREDYDYTNDVRQDYGGYLIQYTLRGTGRYCRKDREWILEEGMAFLVSFPEDSRYYIPQNQKGEWEFWYLHFDGPAAEAFAAYLKEVCGGVFYMRQDSEPVRLVMRMIRRLTSGGRLQKYEGGEFLYRFLCCVLREVEQPFAEWDSLAGKGARIMEEEYCSLGSVEEVAERLHISQAYFSRIFRQEMGITPIEYLTRLRLQGAANDLLNTGDVLEDIAVRNGFSGGNYFCKVFRRYMGMSPVEYRKSRTFGTHTV